MNYLEILFYVAVAVLGQSIHIVLKYYTAAKLEGFNFWDFVGKQMHQNVAGMLLTVLLTTALYLVGFFDSPPDAQSLAVALTGGYSIDSALKNIGITKN